MQDIQLTPTSGTPLRHEDPDFDALNHACQARFTAVLAQAGPHLFTVETPDLYAVFLDALLPDQRQHHTCKCCATFIRRFGHLGCIAADGTQVSALWRDAPAPYTEAVAAMGHAVARGRITGVFMASEPVWGTPEAGGWTHFSVNPPASALTETRGLTADQRMAAKREDFRTLAHGLADYEPKVVA